VYHVEGLRVPLLVHVPQFVPLLVHVPQFGNHWLSETQQQEEELYLKSGWHFDNRIAGHYEERCWFYLCIQSELMIVSAGVGYVYN